MRPALPAMILAALLLAGCDKGHAPDATPGQATPDAGTPAAAAAAPQAVAKGSDLFKVEPEMLDCRAGNKATVKWDVRTQAGVEKVQVFVTASKGKNKGSEKLFVIGSRVGSAETGNWLFAGSQLSLRDLATGKELANILVDDSACRGAAATPAAGA